MTSYQPHQLVAYDDPTWLLEHDVLVKCWWLIKLDQLRKKFKVGHDAGERLSLHSSKQR